MIQTDKRKLAQYDTEFQRYMVERYAEDIPEGNYRDEQQFLFVMEASEQYEVEQEMLAYAKEHPNATVQELDEYFDTITRDGLPPCAAEWDDEDDE